jgi:hypothetical protein
MIKPVMNLDDVQFDDIEDNGSYTSSRGQVSDHIGARKLGYNLTVLPPGMGCARCSVPRTRSNTTIAILMVSPRRLVWAAR